MKKLKIDHVHEFLIQTEQGLQCTGNWTMLHLHALIPSIEHVAFPKRTTLTIDGSQLTHFDSAGALTFLNLLNQLTDQHHTLTLTGFNPAHQSLLDLVRKQQPSLTLPPMPVSHDNLSSYVGKEFIVKLKQMDDFIILLGDLTTHLFQVLAHWKRFRFPNIVSVIRSAGLNALPILALLSFLIGVVLAYQMGLQLQTYGANIFIAYLSGLAVFREFGPLITAIIVAGRTSSAFTAQIGSMVVNEEVDAIRAMGLSAIELLVLPKVIGLTLMFPILIFWSDFFSILGAMFMSKTSLGVGYLDFLERLQESVGSKHFYLGLYKAPAFSIITALVGCFQGFRVLNRTDSIGIQTTKSVVQALFLIIIADAIYSVVYSWMDL